LLVDPVASVAVLVDPVPAVPVPPVPVFVDPVSGPPEVVSVGLVLALPVPGELDAGEAGVEEPLPGVDEDGGGLGLAVLDGLAGLGGQDGVAAALPFPLVLAFAEAFEVAVLMAVALAVPAAGAVAVVVSPGLVLPPPGPLVPLPVALSDGLLTELAGVSLGVAEVVGLPGLAGADDAELGAQLIAGALPCTAEVLPTAPPAAEPIGVPSPFVL
jgi:hypothetical protein